MGVYHLLGLGRSPCGKVHQWATGQKVGDSQAVALFTTSKVYALGPQWELIRPYQEELEEARSHRRTIEEMSETEEWIEQEEIVF